MRTIFTALIAAVGISVISTGASAQMLCKQRTEVLAQLSNTYKEAPVSMGLASNGTVLEVLTSSEQGKTWTILLTQPNGVSCVMATGRSWQAVKQVAMSADPLS